MLLKVSVDTTLLTEVLLLNDCVTSIRAGHVRQIMFTTRKGNTTAVLSNSVLPCLTLNIFVPGTQQNSPLPCYDLLTVYGVKIYSASFKTLGGGQPNTEL